MSDVKLYDRGLSEAGKARVEELLAQRYQYEGDEDESDDTDWQCAASAFAWHIAHTESALSAAQTRCERLEEAVKRGATQLEQCASWLHVDHDRPDDSDYVIRCALELRAALEEPKR